MSTGNSTTNGSEKVGWVPSKPGRSTSEIIWSCVTVLLVCTYKCVHLNMPSVEENEAGWHHIFGIPIWPRWPLLRKSLRQLKWMGIILLAPEYGVAVAYHQYSMAKEEAQQMYHGQKMSLAHGFFSLMGGYAAESPQLSLDTEDEGLLSSYASSGSRKPRLRKTLTLKEYLRHCDINGDLAVTEASLLDRSKADAFTKIFAIVQSSWLITQCISRVAVGLPITELELATMAYISCALLMYIFWWDKPFGAEQPVIVKTSEPVNHGTGDKIPLMTFDHFLQLVALEAGPGSGTIDKMSQLMFYLAATFFSAIHLFAWNWQFPNPGSALAWRISATIATACAPFMIAFTWLSDIYDEQIPETLFDLVGIPVFWLALLAYTASRVSLLVLIMYSFKAMPAGVYETVEWEKYFPHFS